MKNSKDIRNNEIKRRIKDKIYGKSAVNKVVSKLEPSVKKSILKNNQTPFFNALKNSQVEKDQLKTKTKGFNQPTSGYLGSKGNLLIFIFNFFSYSFLNYFLAKNFISKNLYETKTRKVQNQKQHRNFQMKKYASRSYFTKNARKKFGSSDFEDASGNLNAGQNTRIVQRNKDSRKKKIKKEELKKLRPKMSRKKLKHKPFKNRYFKENFLTRSHITKNAFCVDSTNYGSVYCKPPRMFDERFTARDYCLANASSFCSSSTMDIQEINYENYLENCQISNSSTCESILIEPKYYLYVNIPNDDL